MTFEVFSLYGPRQVPPNLSRQNEIAQKGRSLTGFDEHANLLAFERSLDRNPSSQTDPTVRVRPKSNSLDCGRRDFNAIALAFEPDCGRSKAQEADVLVRVQQPKMRRTGESHEPAAFLVRGRRQPQQSNELASHGLVSGQTQEAHSEPRHNRSQRELPEPRAKNLAGSHERCRAPDGKRQGEQERNQVPQQLAPRGPHLGAHAGHDTL